MSLSNEWTDYHLTPHGWVEGSCKVDFQGITTKERPTNAVCTVRHKEYQSCFHAKMEVTQEETWRTDDHAEYTRLKATYGEAPRSL